MCEGAGASQILLDGWTDYKRQIVGGEAQHSRPGPREIRLQGNNRRNDRPQEKASGL